MTHLFRLELETIDQEISVAEQEALSLRHDQTNQLHIVQQDDRKAEVQNQWTSAMLKARDLAIRTTSDCRSAIDVRS